MPVNSETVIFSPGGAKVVCITLDLFDDDILEEEESFSLTIDSVSPTPGVVIGTLDSTTVFIRDIDSMCIYTANSILN